MGRRHRGTRQLLHALPTLRHAPEHTQKKTLIARAQDAAERAAYRAELAEADPAQLVFLDETGASLRLTPLRGRTPRGQRLCERVPRGKWESVTDLACFSLAGVGASVLLPGALDRAALDVFVAEQLAPTLVPGQTVIWDNLSVHKSATARAVIEAAGGRLRFLPRYSPDFTPIEQAFSKLKTGLRRARPRTFEEVVAATGEVIAQITPRDAAGFFIAAGYPVQDGHNL